MQNSYRTSLVPVSGCDMRHAIKSGSKRFNLIIKKSRQTNLRSAYQRWSRRRITRPLHNTGGRLGDHEVGSGSSKRPPRSAKQEKKHRWSVVPRNIRKYGMPEARGYKKEVEGWGMKGGDAVEVSNWWDLTIPVWTCCRSRDNVAFGSTFTLTHVVASYIASDY